MKIVIISGSPRKTANTQIMMRYVFDYTKTKNQETSFINLSEGGVDYYRGPDLEYSETTKQAVKQIMEADVWLIGSPVYNSFFSSALKNLFEFVNYKETAGKMGGIALMASGNISFTFVQSLLNQLLSYFRVNINPKAVFITADMVKEDNIVDADAQNRLKDLVDETMTMSSKLR